MTTDNRKSSQEIGKDLGQDIRKDLGQEWGQELGRELGQEPTATDAGPIDFAFLATQTFADEALEREVLAMFVAQARRLLPTLPALAPQQQADTAHLLKGSARGIGAWAVADAADRYEAATPALRDALLPALNAAMDSAEGAITRHLDTRGA